MVVQLTAVGKPGESYCRGKTIYVPNRLKLMQKICPNGNMQIAAGNRNLRIGRADEGRYMLINELKLDKISQGYVTQGGACGKKERQN